MDFINVFLVPDSQLKHYECHGEDHKNTRLPRFDCLNPAEKTYLCSGNLHRLFCSYTEISKIDKS